MDDIDGIIKCKEQWKNMFFRMITPGLKSEMISIIDSTILNINESYYLCDKEEIKTELEHHNNDLKTTDYTDDQKIISIYYNVLHFLDSCLSDEKIINMNREIKLKQILNER